MICQILIVLLALIAYFVINMFVEANYFKEFKPLNDENCRLLHADGAVGLEDGDEHNGLVVFSSDPRREWVKMGEVDRAIPMRTASNGNLFTFRDGALHKLTLVGMNGMVFHPHGVSLHGETLFVVNHGPKDDDIVVFKIDPTKHTATVQEVIAHDLLHGLNDVHVVSPTEFYVTRCENAPAASPQGIFEAVTKRPWMYVARCAKQGTQWQCAKAIDGLAGPNGINAVGNKFYVATALKHVGVYNRDPKSGNVTYERAVSTHSLVDNLHATKEGRVIATAHFQPFKVMSNFQDASVVSPTIVTEILANGEEKMLISTDKLSCGSIAVATGGQLLIGGVLDAGILVCPEPK